MDNNFEPIYPGFSFLPMPNLPEIGYGVVEIHIGEKPIERFFDTHQAIFPISKEGDLSQLVVEYPWLSEGSSTKQRVCAGRFSFYETDGDERLGFSLGGELEVNQEDNWITCRLTSNAPIYNLQENFSSSERWLVDEIEGALARRRAFYWEDESIYWERLQSVDPFELFAAVLATVRRDIMALPLSARSTYQEQYSHINHIIHLLEVADAWPSDSPSLEHIL